MFIRQIHWTTKNKIAQSNIRLINRSCKQYDTQLYFVQYQIERKNLSHSPSNSSLSQKSWLELWMSCKIQSEMHYINQCATINTIHKQLETWHSIAFSYFMPSICFVLCDPETLPLTELILIGGWGLVMDCHYPGDKFGDVVSAILV